MNLYLGTNTGPNLLHEILDVPPVGESITSPMGRERYYNKAELIILISPATQVAKSGAYNNFATTVPWASVQKTVGAGGKTTGFVDLSPQFLDKREGTVMQVTEVDVQGFTNTSAYLTSVLGRPVRTLYVADLRTGSVNLPAVRLVNGQNLPAAGLTVATPNPLYVRGHYNAPSSALGTTNTTLTAPASLVCDALTVLSTGWSDDHSYYPLAYRRAANTTINAAVITGITPTGGGYYSGGAENILRMLENWRGRTLTFNGSLVVLYASETALSPWGAGWDVYDSGTRKYNFDQNFLNAAKLPSGTPNLRAAFRSVGTPIAAGAK
jgi:hypothetical protein